jgi:tetraacyldisaccharide 4'-kinase
MRAPEFWDAPPGLAAGLLAPAGVAWSMATALRRALARPYRAPVPVVCVGNLVAGGSGKTPIVLSLAARLLQRGIDVHVVLRGYGGHLVGPIRVDPQTHGAEAVGDEAMLLAAAVPCWVARDRAAGIRAATKAGAQLVLLDDGFQNPGFEKDLSLLAIDAEHGLGNGRVIPAGPLREPAEAGLARADAIVLIGEGPVPATIEPIRAPVLHAALEPVAGERFAGRRVLAFAGIGRPGKFFSTLKTVGAEIVAARAFPDHHRFSAPELVALHRDAAAADATLVTTAKDWVRLPLTEQQSIEVLAVELRWRDTAALDRILTPAVADDYRARASRG